MISRTNIDLKKLKKILNNKGVKKQEKNKNSKKNK